MTSPALELQKALLGALSGDAALTAALGGQRIHDRPPANAAFPYITFGRTSVYDWSTGTEPGTEQILTLHIWSKAQGKKEALEIMELARARLEGEGITMPEFALVSLFFEFAEVRYDDDLAVHHGLLRFRARLEPVA